MNPYDMRPLMIYWEMTRACDLACRHCRAEAIPWRDPRELSSEEGYSLLERLAAFGAPLPHLVFTGGDPLVRPDLFDLIACARKLGFQVAVTPSGTTRLTADILEDMHRAGVWMLSLSLDGSTPERHDALRGVPGSYAQTVQAACWAKDSDLPLQVNSLVCAETLEDLPALFSAVSELGVAQWALFFLVRVGRGSVLQEMRPEESEQLLGWVYDLAQKAPFRIRTTEAPHYRRIGLQRVTTSRRSGGQRIETENARSSFGVWDGNGVMFISHIGEIYPAGFLPLIAGDVRRDDPVEVYQGAPLFRSLRDPDQWGGKCGFCEFRRICGGSRARAYAATGDPLASDPLCPYEPAVPRRRMTPEEGNH